jgi:hypothetical protein
MSLVSCCDRAKSKKGSDPFLLFMFNQGRLADPSLARQEHELPRTLQGRPPQRVQASKE